MTPPRGKTDTSGAYIEVKLPIKLYRRLAAYGDIGPASPDSYGTVSVGLGNTLILAAEAHAQAREASK